MFRPVLLPIVLLVALGTAGCAAGPLVRDAPAEELPSEYPNHSAAFILDAVAEAAAGVEGFRADGRLTVTSPTLNQNATFSFRGRLADSLLAVVRGPFGIEGARALVTPDSFLAHDRLGGRLYVGRVEAADRFVPGAGSSDVLQRALVGLLVPEAPPAAWTVSAEGGLYTLARRRPDGSQQQVDVNPAFWRVVGLRETSSGGILLAEQRFEQFDTVDGVVLPRRVVLSSPEQPLLLVLEHTRLVLNPPDLTFPYTRPRGVEVVPIN
ncbi:MAG: DUF4292 domain-containing protein [Rubricoccaceae bacterium]